MPAKVYLKDGKICNQTSMRKGLKIFDEVGIVDETKDLGLRFVEKTESGLT